MRRRRRTSGSSTSFSETTSTPYFLGSRHGYSLRTTTDRAGGDYDRRMSRTRARLAPTLLTVLALLLQLPVAVVLAVNGEAGAVAAGVRIGVAVASPVVFAVFVRWPGRGAAILAALTLLDILLWAASADQAPMTALHGAGPGRWPGGPGGMWTQGFSSPEITPFYAAFLFALVAAMAEGKQIWAIASAAGVWLGSPLFGPLLGIE